MAVTSLDNEAVAIGEWAVVLWLFSSGCYTVASLANEAVATGCGETVAVACTGGR